MDAEWRVCFHRHEKSTRTVLCSRGGTMEDNTPRGLSAFARRPTLAGGLVIAALLLGTSEPAVAQQTRAESISAQQADKQRAVAPPSWNGAEVVIDRLEDWGFFTGQPRGVYPWF